MSEEYNGWTNYSTWLLMTWMDEEGDYWVEDIKNHRSIDSFKNSIQEVWELRQEDLLSGCGFFVDLVNAGMCEVNWYEIAEKIWNDNQEEDEDYDDSDSSDNTE